jgi:hypothetical protein
LSLRGAFATRQSDPKHVRWQIAASQTLLAMTGVEDRIRQNENC